MYALYLLPILINSAIAQSTTLYLNLLWPPEKTLTLQASDATATTFEKICPTTTDTTTTSTSIVPPTYNGVGQLLRDVFHEHGTNSTSAPSEMSAYEASILSRYWREESTALYETIPESERGGCVPFTLFQGPETWGFQLTRTDEAGATGVIRSGDCSWKGAFTTASLTCDAYVDMPGLSHASQSGVSVLGHDELRSSLTAFAVATIVTGTATVTGSDAAPRSTAPAPSVPIPTAAMVIAGGAAGIFAVAF